MSYYLSKDVHIWHVKSLHHTNMWSNHIEIEKSLDQKFYKFTINNYIWNDDEFPINNNYMQNRERKVSTQMRKIVTLQCL